MEARIGWEYCFLTVLASEGEIAYLVNILRFILHQGTLGGYKVIHEFCRSRREMVVRGSQEGHPQGITWVGFCREGASQAEGHRGHPQGAPHRSQPPLPLQGRIASTGTNSIRVAIFIRYLTHFLSSMMERCIYMRS